MRLKRKPRSPSLPQLASPKLRSIFLTLFVALALPASRYIPVNSPNASAFIEQGHALYNQGRLNEAIWAYREAVKINSEDALVYSNLGKVLGDQGNLDEALAAYRKALQLNPSLASIHNSLGNGLYDQGKLEEAIAAYQKAIQLNPQLAYVYNNLGNALSEQGRIEDAIAAFRQSIQLNPNNAVVHTNLGQTLQQQGKLEAAIHEFQQALQLNSNISSAKLYLQEAQRQLALQQKPQLSLVPEQLPSQKEEPFVSLKRSVVRIIRNSSSDWHIGTGWVLKRKGAKAWIVTNRHVVTEGGNPLQKQQIEVEFYSEPPSGQFRKRQLARIAKTTSVDDKLDLAVLEVTNIPKDIQPLPLASTAISPHTTIHTIGNPSTTGDWTVATGEVIHKTPQELQLSALSAPGNSGAPVLDKRHRVMGVVWGRRSRAGEQSGPALAFPLQQVTQQLRSWGIH